MSSKNSTEVTPSPDTNGSQNGTKANENSATKKLRKDGTEAKPRGGRRPGAGRKTRAAEFGLHTMIDSIWTVKDQKETIRRLVERAVKGDMEAIKLLMAYRFGKPPSEMKVSGSIDANLKTPEQWQIGRASCRERV